MTTSPFDSYRDPEPEGGRRRRRDKRRRPAAWLSGRGEGRGEQALVPDAEFSSYYGRNIVKPAPWSPAIPAYLFLGGLAAGSQLLALGAHLTGNDALCRSTRLTSAVAAALGGAALVDDLGKKSRFLNMLRTVKLTSPMSVGTWIFSGFTAGAMPAAAAELTRIVDVPGGRLIRAVETPAAVVGAVFSPPLAAYTAVLLSGTATPTWHAAYRELPYLFVGSAAAASGGMAMALTPVRAAGPARTLAVAGAAADLVASQLMERSIGMVGEPLHRGRAGVLNKLSLGLNIAGAVGAVAVGRNRLGATLSGLALVSASVATRFAIFDAGMASADDPRYTVEPQRARLDARGGRDSITTA